MRNRGRRRHVRVQGFHFFLTRDCRCRLQREADEEARRENERRMREEMTKLIMEEEERLRKKGGCLALPCTSQHIRLALCAIWCVLCWIPSIFGKPW